MREQLRLCVYIFAASNYAKWEANKTMLCESIQVMDSFKVYLPSNASLDRFPNNSPSNFHTELRHPMHLEGNWEVGLESIFYSSKLDSMKEKGSLQLQVKMEKTVDADTLLPVRFRWGKDKTWLGYEGVKVKPAKNTTVDEVIVALNSANDLIMLNGDKVFEFSRTGDTLIFKTFISNFHVVLSHKMNAFLGLRGYELSSPGYKMKIKDSQVKLSKPKHYTVNYFCPDILEEETSRIIPFDNKNVQVLAESLFNYWRTHVAPLIGINMEVSKSKKVILHHQSQKKGLFLSPELQNLLSQKGHLFAYDSRWGWTPLKPMEDAWKKIGMFYVIIYTNKVKKIVVERKSTVDISFIPHQFDTIDNILTYLNRSVLSKIKSKTGDAYNDEKHKFLFTQFNNRVKLSSGQWIHTTLDDNLCHILGFKEKVYENGIHEGERMPATLQDREQLFYIVADFIKSVPFGVEKLPILREFIHDVTDDTKIIEKRFQPVSYIPVSKPYIIQMHIAIVNQLGKPIVMKDVKTILTLHFRRVQ